MMALIKNFVEQNRQHPQAHEEVYCTYACFSRDEKTYLQIDTYGSLEREIKGAVSQSIQFDLDSAKKLLNLIKDTFSIR